MTTKARNFRGISVCSVFLMCFSLALIPGSADALSSASSIAVIDWDSLVIDVSGLTIQYHDNYVNSDDNRHISYSDANVWSRTDEAYYNDTQSSATYVDTAADASITGASAEARAAADLTLPDQTKIDNALYGMMSAESTGIGSNSWAWGGAERWVYFDVTAGSGLITLTADYIIDQTIGVDAVNDVAYAYSEVWLELYNQNTNEVEPDDWPWIERKLKYTAGETKTDLLEGSMEVSLNYSAGDSGYMWMGVYNEVNAKTKVPSPVPEPATMFLLGSGLIGLAGFRRKFRSN